MSHIDKLTKTNRVSLTRRESKLVGIWRTSTLELVRRPDKLEVLQHPDATEIDTGELDIHYPSLYTYPSPHHYPATG